MKRPANDVLSSDDSSDSDSDENNGKNNKFGLPNKSSKSEVMSRQKKLGFDALSKHGYRGGPSVLKVPAPKEPEKEPDWSWSTGKDQNTPNNTVNKTEESFEERERTRAALVQAEKLLHVRMNKNKEEKNKSFAQKEKKKRDLGQASRGKNYVEEEKRLLRDSGVYSGFDS